MPPPYRLPFRRNTPQTTGNRGRARLSGFADQAPQARGAEGNYTTFTFKSLEYSCV
nr:hypothetical protein SHINE37_40017 [Rhizobiaceae bacterium]